MSGAINNGYREQVRVGGFSGKGGVVEQADGTLRVAVWASSTRFRAGQVITIGARTGTVLGVAASDPAKGGVAGMAVLDVSIYGKA